MAKKRVTTKGKTMPATAVDTELKLVRLELPPDIQLQFRVESSKEGKSMAAMARQLVEDWVAKRKGGEK